VRPGHEFDGGVGTSAAFIISSALGATVFFHAGDWPAGLLCIGLAAVYVCDLLVAVGTMVFDQVPLDRVSRGPVRDIAVNAEPIPG
jgi:hypothetical protein